MRDLTKGNPRSVIMAFAVPVMIGYMLQLCYSLADTRIVSSFIGEEALSAVGATTSLSGMIIGFLNGLTNGFAVIVARYFGAKDYKNLKRSVAASLTCGIIISIVLTTACLFGLNTILHVLNVPEQVYAMAYRYIFIIFIIYVTMSINHLISYFLSSLIIKKNFKTQHNKTTKYPTSIILISSIILKITKINNETKYNKTATFKCFSLCIKVHSFHMYYQINITNQIFFVKT